MFVTYHSNSAELFMKLIIDTISCCKLSNPLQSEIILIEHNLMKQWIEIELTKHFGISANVMFMSIEFFIQKIAIELFPKNDIINDVNHIFLYWKFMEVLSKFCSKTKYSIISKYLFFDVNQQKCSQLSEKIVNLFSEYLIYRSDWLDLWEYDKTVDGLDVDNQTWQSQIWRMLLKNMQYSSQEFNCARRCIHFLQNNIQGINWSKLPNRMFIYGIISIPPIYWKILTYLSRYLDIYIWIVSPNIEKAEIITPRSMYDDINNHSYHLLYNTSHCKSQYTNHNRYDDNGINNVQNNHSLLKAWGKIGQDMLSFLHHSSDNISTIKNFILPNSDSLLNLLQRSILNFKNTHVDLMKKPCEFFDKNNKTSYLFHSLDQSISIHECYSIQREVEVLHNNILSMLSNDPFLLLGDIIVMSPNIECYISAINNVFNNTLHRRLPFSISGSFDDYANSIKSSVLDVLNLSNSRFTSEEVLSLLSVPSISSKFNINDEELKLLKVWIVESGIRWGLDDKTMHNFNIPITHGNTWYFGLKRILLGYAIDSSDNVWENISPYPYIDEDHVDILYKFIEFLEKLRKWRDRLNCLYTLTHWITNFNEIIDDFFDYKVLNSKENRTLFLLKSYWIDIVESGIKSKYLHAINISVLRDKLITKLQKKNISYHFLPNVINFFNITPLCHIPCKILYIIGMNAHDFPKFNNLEYNFNLIVKQPRVGDKTVLEKDLYTFLLICLLPKSKLYFSFIKKSVFNISSMDSVSVLVYELLEYIALNLNPLSIRNYSSNAINNIQYVYEHLLQKHSSMPYDPVNFFSKSKTLSFADEWLAAANNYNNLNVLTDFKFVSTLPKISISTIVLADLYNFYKHPVRMWFQKRLCVYFYQFNKYEILTNHETFSVNNLYRFILNSKLLDYLVHDRNPDALYYEFRDSGLLPYGSHGQLYWIKQYEIMNVLANQIKFFYSSSNALNVNFSLKFKKIELTGNLNSVYKYGLIRWKASNLSMKDCFLMWMEHLIYCASGGIGDSRLFGINSVWHFSNFSKSQAKELLFFLISGYISGMNSPLILLYQCGGIWIDHVFDRNSKTIRVDKNIQKKASQKLIKSWQDHSRKCFFNGNENTDPYLRKLIPSHLNEEYVQIITNTARNYFLYVMQYRVL